MTGYGGHSVLQVPVPALEPWVRERTAFYDRDYVSDDPAFGHAHVTALAPFLTAPDEQALARVAEIAGRVPPFDYVLERTGTFPNGIVHLLPDPDGGFRRLTRLLVEAFPQCPPYAGQFPDPVPHVTLDALSEHVTEASTRAAVAPFLPARSRATRLDLAWYEPGRCRVLHSWPLGRAAQDQAAQDQAAQNS
ncbi:2'-5' RNA ligase family protein [Nocardioides campestrisoli]|uniref:2'-5' RNA ligase family protein n=1 Tax=Nocardioides campestrisoli TaxID=2736757 RepID=UPI0015E7C549|nr:2'-5' RNA ligase family protein [Nocardioides campestrisoli]